MNNEIQLSNWKKWKERNSFENLNYPGVYCISIIDKNISNEAFFWLEEIKYIGMTNSRGGLKSRLKQFDNTIIGKTGHGGADRFRYKHENYLELVDKLYVAIHYFECNVKSNKPEDLIEMGNVAKAEYILLADYAKRFGKLPEFNDKPNSPKWSLTKGRNILTTSS